MRAWVMSVLVGLGMIGLPLRAAGYGLLDQLAQTYVTPKAIAAFLQHDFTFVRDEQLFGEADHWQSPEEFVARKQGDCEDYALLAQALLRRHGIQADVLSLLGEEGYAHTVSVFLDERGRYNAINQGHLVNYHAPSLQAVASAIHPGWTVAMIAEQEGTRGRIVREIFNDDPAPAGEELASLL